MNNPPGSQMAYAPGRVNLIGEHTDYNGGLALPMAINLGVRVTHRPAPGSSIVVESDLAPRTVALDIPLPELPQWARLAGAIATALDASYGARVVVQSNLPVGVGLSSSAAFGVAFALALGAEPIPLDIARLCQRAEEAVGVPVGLMDPLVSMSALSDHALLVDFTTLESQPVPLPPGVEVVVIDSGFTRTLDRSPYAARRRQCEDAAKAIGRPLGLASRDEIEQLRDPLLQRRARHVVSEVARVRAFVGALERKDFFKAGALMVESHRSLRDDFEVSTSAIDALVDEVVEFPEVYGARMTGAGFGGCLVALCHPGANIPSSHRTWRVRASAGARVSKLQR